MMFKDQAEFVYKVIMFVISRLHVDNRMMYGQLAQCWTTHNLRCIQRNLNPGGKLRTAFKSPTYLAT